LAPANVPVLSGHYDAFLSGANTQETTLTPATVKATNFGNLFNYAVDGYTYAQPLYVPNLAIAGGTHNVVFAATEHDSVYAFDADGGGQLWQRSFINPGAGVTSVPQAEVITGDIVPEIGITGTPVISGTTMFVVVKTKEVVSSVTHYVQRLHALDITTGLDRATNGVVTIGDTTIGGPDGGYTDNTPIVVAGTGDGSDGTNVRFNALRENQRTALTLANGGTTARITAGSSAIAPVTCRYKSSSTPPRTAARRAYGKAAAVSAWMPRATSTSPRVMASSSRASAASTPRSAAIPNRSSSSRRRGS
jgi:hypothetical protein